MASASNLMTVLPRRIFQIETERGVGFCSLFLVEVSSTDGWRRAECEARHNRLDVGSAEVNWHVHFLAQSGPWGELR